MILATLILYEANYKSLADNAVQGLIDWMNLTVKAEEINEITRQQYELQSSWEKVRSTVLSLSLIHI